MSPVDVELLFVILYHALYITMEIKIFKQVIT